MPRALSPLLRRSAGLLPLLAALLSPSAQALDVDAGDYTALPAGTTLGLVYAQHASRDKLYAAGDKLPGRNGLDSDIGILRGVRYMEIGGKIVDPQFLLPFGKLKGKDDLSVLGSNSGVGYLILAATVWFNKPSDTTHFGITPFLILPTGQYDRNDPLSLGENRWRFVLQSGFITPVTDKLTLDLIGDVTVFGKNSDFGPAGQTLKQKPQVQLQSYLRYAVVPGGDLRLGWSHTSGGETRVDGVDRNDRLSSQKVQFGGSYFVRPTTQLTLTLGRDLSVRQGFKEESRVNLRLLQVF